MKRLENDIIGTQQTRITDAAALSAIELAVTFDDADRARGVVDSDSEYGIVTVLLMQFQVEILLV